MKIVSTILAAGAVLLLTVATVFGSEHERQEGKEYNHHERGESKFYGTVERIPEGTLGTWNVNGREILVTKDTRIKEKHGRAKEGTYVKVEGGYSDKTFIAHEIEVERTSERGKSKFHGTVERIPEGTLGTWNVNGREILVTKDTKIEEQHGKAKEGTYVEVEGGYSGKTYIAHKIEVKRTKR